MSKLENPSLTKEPGETSPTAKEVSRDTKLFRFLPRGYKLCQTQGLDGSLPPLLEFNEGPLASLPAPPFPTPHAPHHHVPFRKQLHICVVLANAPFGWGSRP